TERTKKQNQNLLTAGRQNPASQRSQLHKLNYRPFPVGLWLAVPAQAATIINHPDNSAIAVNTTWHDGEVHVIADGATFWVNPNAKLVIEAGVVLKVGYNSVIRVNGDLAVKGTADKLVEIVSLRDDTVAGDTNGDGLATVANLNDWRGIMLEGHRYNSIVNAEFNYAVIKHGGRGWPRGMVINTTKVASLKIDHCNIIDNSGIVFIDASSGNVSIHNSNFYSPDFCDYNDSVNLCHWDNGVTNFSSQTTDLSNNYWGSPAGPTYTTGPDPTVFTGVVLGNPVNGNVIYQPFATQPFVFGVKELNPVILIPGIMGSWNVSGQWRLDPVLHTYDDLWAALQVAGYEEGKTLFALPYEWRHSNLDTMTHLRDKINEVKEICQCDKVDLIGHSMGGLVARAYIEGPFYGDDVDKVVFLATPHRGATKTYLMWEGGSVGIMWFDQILQRIFDVEAESNGYGYISQYLKNYPILSVKELLPIYDYLRDKATGLLRNYPDNYPRNEFLEFLNSPDALAKLSAVKIFNFIANSGDDSTVDSLRVVSSSSAFSEWEYGYPENYDSFFGDHGLEYNAGDTTVPQRSNIDFAGAENIFINSDHTSIITDAQKAVIKDLTGIEPTQEIRQNLIRKVFMVRIFSPADFLIVAPDGKRLGRDSQTGQDVSEISGAYYSGSAGGPEYAIIPEPLAGDYRIGLSGTGNGEYRLSASLISDAISADNDFSGQIVTGQSRDFVVSYSDAAGAGELKPQDNTPPIITIMSPDAVSAYLRRSELKLDYAVSDDFSGVGEIALAIDGQAIATATVDLSAYVAGQHLLSVTARDLAGNEATATTVFIVSASIVSAIADINDFYSQGLISKKNQNLLANPLELLQVKFRVNDLALFLAQRARDLLADNDKLKPAVKEKLLGEADKAIEKIKTNRREIITKQLDIFDKRLDEEMIAGQVYDILKADSIYLRNNL
ncbi:MAG: alpha/beta fold hydrolase, partial [Patescibacteria group bacterium]